MNLQKLYNDFSIPYASSEDRHYHDGWVHTKCPFCSGNPGYHLGWNEDENYFNCFRCGFHRTTITISQLLKISEPKARDIIKQYKGVIKTKQAKVKIRRKAHRLPSNSEALTAQHKNYLISRGFDPDYLKRKYGLLGTGPVSHLDHIDFKHRIVAPINWGGNEVSFQARDITDRSRLKYITCSKDRELVFHKDILYGEQIYWQNTGICVEGITDVWRFGDYSFATFGIKYTHTQVRLIANTFKRVAVVFDDESQAVIQANKLVGELKFRGVDAWRVSVDGDPGAMKQVDADSLVKTIIG